MIEPLEARIAPAVLTFLSSKAATYTDVDGDLVTITITKGDLHLANYVLTDTGAVGGAQLKNLDFKPDILHFAGTNLTIAAKRANGLGDARVNVGEIDSTGMNLGTVTVHGDLGRIAAGSDSTKPAVASFKVGSLGFFGTTTGAPNLISTFTGKLGGLTVTSDVIGANIISNGVHGGIGNIIIGGSLLAGSSGANGKISAQGDIGLIKIGGNLKAGSNDESGKIIATGKLAGLTIGGSLYGGSDASADSTQQIGSIGNMGPVKIGGSIFGGTGPQSGGIESVNGSIASVTIGGNLIAGTGAKSGDILAGTSIGPVKIDGNLTASATDETGKIAALSIASVFIGGSLIGNDGNYDINEGHSSQIHADAKLGAVSILGSVVGGKGAGSAEIYGGQSVTSVTIGGSLLGGAGTQSGSIHSLKLGAVKIGGDMQGDATGGTGSIFSTSLASVTVSGSVLGSQIYGGTIGAVVIDGSLAGPDAAHPARIIGSGSFNSNLALKSLKVLGDVKFAVIDAGANLLLDPGSPDAQIGSISVGGDWLASSVVAGVDPKAGGFGDGDDVKGPDTDKAGVFSKIGSISIGGQISGTTAAGDHYGFVAQQIGSFKIDGVAIPLFIGTHNDLIQIGLTGDVTIREIAL